MQRRFFKRALWPWLFLQIGWGVLCVTLVLCRFHVHLVMKIQWIGIFTIMYCQWRVGSPFKGFAVVFAEDHFERWGFLRAAAAPDHSVLMVYRKELLENGNTACWCWPFKESRWVLLNLFKYWGIRLLVYIRIIK